MLCFRKILVAIKFMDKTEGEVSSFSFRNFSSHSAGKSCTKTRSVSLISGIENVYA